jgi:hypothetical protein
MNKIHKMFRSYKLLVVAMLILLGQSPGAFAKDNGCWAEFYEYAQFIGEKLRLDGPLKLPNLKNVDGHNWDSRIDSVVVGPKARVIIYENLNFKLTLTEMSKYPGLMRSLGITEEDIRQDSEIILAPKSMTHHLGEYNFHKKTRSLKIECL